MEGIVWRASRNVLVSIYSKGRFRGPKECERRCGSYPLRGVFIQMLYFCGGRTGLCSRCFDKRGGRYTARKRKGQSRNREQYYQPAPT